MDNRSLSSFSVTFNPSPNNYLFSDPYMFIIQTILLLFFLFAVIKVISRYRAGDLTAVEMAMWVIFWIAAGVVVILPDSTFYLARLVGIGRGADLIVYLSLALLFFMFFRLMVRLEKMERNMTRLTRKISLDEKNNER